MPLTKYQSEIAHLLAKNRSEDSYLAGGSALHFKPNSIRYSQDLDYFHDSEHRVAKAFKSDHKILIENKYLCEIELNQPGYIRCIVTKNKNNTKIEWAHDSSWRFLKTQLHPKLGYVLHPVDLTINKILALAGRDEPRDYLDVHHTIQTILPLGAQIWAACGKDPGFNPKSLLELLKRRGKYHPEDFNRLQLNTKVDLQKMKQNWLLYLEDAERFTSEAPPQDLGCLYYSKNQNKFIQPNFNLDKDIEVHFGKSGGVIPRIIENH